MNLTLKDRVLILNTVLPQFDTRKNMELKVSIDRKITISEVDQKRIVVKDLGGGQINIGFTDAAAITETTDIALTDEELQYLLYAPVMCYVKRLIELKCSFSVYLHFIHTFLLFSEMFFLFINR